MHFNCFFSTFNRNGARRSGKFPIDVYKSYTILNGLQPFFKFNSIVPLLLDDNDKKNDRKEKSDIHSNRKADFY